MTTPRPLSALRDLLSSEAASGVVLMVTALLALVVANSPLGPAYRAALHAHLGPLDVVHWINDALMALFFLLVGLEIKREVIDGHLSSWSRRALPGIAAAGGMIVPALIFVAVARHDPAVLRGWAIPTATDIAFALGVLALLGRRAPVSLKIFLTALAIVDDLGAVAIIAVFYTAGLQPLWLALAALAIAAGAAMNRLRVARLWPYLLLGVLLWLFVWRSGVHATLAGIALALVVPIRRSPGRPDDAASPLHRLEHALGGWVGYGVLPLFAFANAGVAFGGLDAAAVTAALPVGIALGLFVGKQAGVFGASLLAIRCGWARRPERATLLQLYGVSLLCGVGFTMSLFVGQLAFAGSPLLQDEVRLAVLAGSFAAALAGALVLLLAGKRRNPAR